jgi:hypothetical protein
MNKPTTPTTCQVSDLLNSIYNFVNDNPNWLEDDEACARLSMAYHILTKISGTDMVSNDEYEFVMDIHTTLKERFCK